MVPLNLIEIDPDRRQPTRNKVDFLASSMKDGLHTPITVCLLGKRPVHRTYPYVNLHDPKKYILVTGAHRLAAAEKLGWGDIEAFIIVGDDVKDADIELWEIDENLCRAKLTPTDEADAVARRKKIYETLHPETKHGGAPGKAGGGKAKRERSQIEISGEAASFIDDTAAKTGKSRTTVARAANRGKEIGADNLAKIRGTSLDKGVELDALAELSEADRAPLIERAAAGEKVSARPRTGDAEIAAIRKRIAELPPTAMGAAAAAATEEIEPAKEKVKALPQAEAQAGAVAAAAVPPRPAEGTPGNDAVKATTVLHFMAPRCCGTCGTPSNWRQLIMSLENEFSPGRWVQIIEMLGIEPSPAASA
jgi:hypothetical protein